MSIRHLLILVTLTPLFTSSERAQVRPTAATVSIADLLLRDEVQKAEQTLQSAPRTAENLSDRPSVASL